MMMTIRAIPQVVIAQVEGLATAAGCQLVASADLAVCGESSRFQVPGGRGWLVLHHPRRRVGQSRRTEDTLSRCFSPEIPSTPTRHLPWGLVNRVVPDDEVASGHRGAARPGDARLRSVERHRQTGLLPADGPRSTGRLRLRHRGDGLVVANGRRAGDHGGLRREAETGLHRAVSSAAVRSPASRAVRSGTSIRHRGAARPRSRPRLRGCRRQPAAPPRSRSRQSDPPLP